ncbi:P-loop containing nucleoside triphosphate hydrolase protein [Mollisia scopiformis]|uniref:p-loop containing nucleoside triphosphate hydrolase protein n=1 Tax=Mollisia scopiformis TaxID=149040 RepID=A0A132B8T6_MOLSC|nr:P-loop containing nucleoside triphosphate hydrolase protein [Mollisia scopiformis]KUJ08818.1 P-loop containing nucleoside triphosphate hydrolase protein [Mollisia scopiformis]
MGEQDTSMMAPNHDAFETIFNGYKKHFDGTRTSTELTMLELLRKSHPNFHITCCGTHKCDLLGFAAAGHATSTLDKGSNDELYDATRSYKSPGPRMFFAGKPGLLRDNTRFGRYKYVWNDQEFLLYEVEYTAPFKPATKIFYLLSPRTLSSASEEGTSSATDALLLAVGSWSTDLHKEIYVFDDGRWSKDASLYTSVRLSSWDDVILSPIMKTSLISDVQGFFDNRPLYKSLSVPWKRGIILHGLPGNGKTISIKALIAALEAREDPVPSLYVKSFDACQGQKFSIRQIFTHARIMAPCLLIFEDLDSLITPKTRSYFLNEVDGLESNDGILMLGSTNHLESLDPAISKRPSRFDRKYHFELPGRAERTAYCEFWRRKVGESELVRWEEGVSGVVAGWSEGFSFAYLKELFVVALLTVARGGDVSSDAQETPDLKTEDENHLKEEKATPVAAADGEKAETKKEEKKKRTLPEVEVPEHLKDNQFLKAIKAQLQILLDEMDSTKEEDWPSDKPKGSGGLRGLVRRRMARGGDSDDD